MNDILKTIVMGIVEGVTEFLPISSTGHLAILGSFIHLSADEEFNKAFDVLIQLPAILAVVVLYWKKLLPLNSSGLDRKTLELWFKIIVAFLPAAVVGFLFHHLIENALGSNTIIACALLIGGAVIIAIERRRHSFSIETVYEIGYNTALLIGMIQCLSMIPGTSRSAATIIGAMLLGASRPAAAEFSFFLAVPTMAGACALTIAKHGVHFTPHQWQLALVGGAISFVVSLAVIAFLIRYVQRHSFEVFGYYRILLGAVVLASVYFSSAT